MKIASAAAGTAVFFVLAPGVVVGLAPWWITHWRMTHAVWNPAPSRYVAMALIVAGIAGVVECFVRFALKGRGTPAPVLPTEQLVVSGLYRYVRNPMYVSLLAILLGQSFLFGNAWLLLYTAIAWLITHIFVLLYEEPTLKRAYGPQYDAYCAHVPRWFPRMTPWRAR